MQDWRGKVEPTREVAPITRPLYVVLTHDSGELYSRVYTDAREILLGEGRLLSRPQINHHSRPVVPRWVAAAAVKQKVVLNASQSSCRTACWAVANAGCAWDVGIMASVYP